VPEGTILYLPLTHVALNDPRFVEQQPEAFIPERMLTPEGMKQGAQIPFGHGPRYVGCVMHGMCLHGWRM
jgi:cytochrome P450